MASVSTTLKKTHQSNLNETEIEVPFHLPPVTQHINENQQKQIIEITKKSQILINNMTLELKLMPIHPTLLWKQGNPVIFHTHQRSEHIKWMQWLQQMFTTFKEKTPQILSSIHIQTIEEQTIPIQSLLLTQIQAARQASSTTEHLGIAWGTIERVDQQNDSYILQVSDFSNQPYLTFQMILSRYYYTWNTVQSLIGKKMICYGYFTMNDLGMPTVWLLSLPHQLALYNQASPYPLPLPQIQRSFLQKQFRSLTPDHTWFSVGMNFFRPYFSTKRNQYEQMVHEERALKQKELRLLEHQIQTLYKEIRIKQSQHQTLSREIKQWMQESINKWHPLKYPFSFIKRKKKRNESLQQLKEQKRRCAQIIQKMTHKKEKLLDQAMLIRQWLEQDQSNLTQLNEHSAWEKKLKSTSIHSLIHAYPIEENQLMIIETMLREQEGQIEITGKLRPYLFDHSYYIPLRKEVQKVRLIAPIHQWKKYVPLYWDQVQSVIDQQIEKKEMLHIQSIIHL